MKTRIVFHYFLFLTIVLGGFASMAQNDYGLTVVSWACYLFALSSILELIQRFNGLSIDKVLELLALAVLFCLFGLRADYIHFVYVEQVLLITCIILVGVYLVHGYKKMKFIEHGNKRLKNLVLAYYASLIGFTISIVITIFFPSISEIIGGISAGLLGVFVLGTALGRWQIVNGERIKTSIYLRKQAGHSTILMTGYFLITVYSGLYMLNILPPLYTHKLPHSYIMLINDAETGKEKPVNGVFKHEVYSAAYAEFLEKHDGE